MTGGVIGRQDRFVEGGDTHGEEVLVDVHGSDGVTRGRVRGGVNLGRMRGRWVEGRHEDTQDLILG